MRAPSRGPLTAEQIREESRHELSDGFPVYCAPAGGQHGSSALTGGLPLATDPLVDEAGTDVGYSADPSHVRAPDLAVGNVPNRPGWVGGAPPLAVEYADVGQDEADLLTKIKTLFGAGTKLVWVVRLTGPRRVEVFEPQQPPRTAYPGSTLTAPGILQNAVPVEALYDRDAAMDAALTNLLNRKGYASLASVREQGIEEGLRVAVRDLCEVLEIELDVERLAALAAMDQPRLTALRDAIKRERRWPSLP